MFCRRESLELEIEGVMLSVVVGCSGVRARREGEVLEE